MMTRKQLTARLHNLTREIYDLFEDSDYGFNICCLIDDAVNDILDEKRVVKHKPTSTICGGKRWTIPPETCPSCGTHMGKLKSLPPASRCYNKKCGRTVRSTELHMGDI